MRRVSTFLRVQATSSITWMAFATLRAWTLTARPCASTSSFLFASAQQPSVRLNKSFFNSVGRATNSRSQSTWTWTSAASSWKAWRLPPRASLHEYLALSWRTRAGTYRARPNASSPASSWRGRLARSPGDPPPPHGSPSGSGRGPFESLRRWFNMQPPGLLVWSIIGLNAGLYFAWQFAIDQMVRLCKWVIVLL